MVLIRKILPERSKGVRITITLGPQGPKTTVCMGLENFPRHVA